MNLNLQIYQLKNGAKIYYNPIPRAKNAAIYLGLLGGVINERKNGIAHLFEHMMVVEANYYKKQVEKHFDKFRWNYEANTYKGYIEFGVNVPKNNFIAAITAISQSLQKPRFLSKDINREKQRIIKEWHWQRKLDYGLADHNLDRAIFKSPFSNPTVGDYKTIKSLNRNDLLKYWNNVLKGNRLKIAVSGAVPKDGLIATKQLFSTISKGKTSIRRILNWYKNKRRLIIADYLPIRKIFLKVCIPVNKLRFYKAAAAILIASIFASSTKSFLDKAFRRLKINRSIGAGIFEYQQTVYLNISFTVPPPKTLRSLSILLETWKQFCGGRLKLNKPKQTKTFFIKENEEKIRCPACIAKEIIQETIYTPKRKQFLLPIDKINEFSRVKNGDIAKTIQSFSRPKDWTISIVGNRNSVSNRLIFSLKKILL